MATFEKFDSVFLKKFVYQKQTQTCNTVCLQNILQFKQFALSRVRNVKTKYFKKGRSSCKMNYLWIWKFLIQKEKDNLKRKLSDVFHELITKKKVMFIIWKWSEFNKQPESTIKIVNANVNANVIFFYYDFIGHT